jgi:hypothetical protein
VHVAANVAMQGPPAHEQLGPLHCAPALPGLCWHVADEPLHVSVVQGLPSSGHAAPALPAGPPHTPPVHWSWVHGFESKLHKLPSGFAGVEQAPLLGSHEPAV